MFNVKSSTLSIIGSLCLVMGLCALAALGSRGNPMALAAPAATTWYVDAATGDDGDDCLSSVTACETIGAAMGKASGGDTIEIAAGTYNEHDLAITKALTLNGAGAQVTIVDAGAAGRGFTVSSTTVISGVCVQNGQTSSGGGAIMNGAIGGLTLHNVLLTDNATVGHGGGIYNLGALTLENTVVVSNTASASGGAIYNSDQGTITITRSTLAHNTALGSASGGGGIFARGRALTIEDSTIADNASNYLGGGLHLLMIGGTAVLDRVTISGNQATQGAGLYAAVGPITLTNTTVTGNVAGNNYGGLYAYAGFGYPVTLTLQNCTIANNTDLNSVGTGTNGLVALGDATATLRNTILADNEGHNCMGSAVLTSQGHNLSDDATCELTQSGDQPGADPLLGLLADNGGFVETQMPRVGSPAIDMGDDAHCPATDARGVARPYDGDGDTVATCDIGAVETRNQFNIADTTVVEGDATSVTAWFTITLAPAGTKTVSVHYATVDGSATGGVDYTPVSGTLIFDPGDTQKIFQVTVLGDTDDEVDETFDLQLSMPVEADLFDGVATCTIVDNDGLPTLAIGDETRLEGNAGTAPLNFEVTLSPPSTSVVTVDYATSNGTATAESDYTAAADTLTFQPGEISKTISIGIMGDLVDEGMVETFTLQLADPVSATLANGLAIGTITDDDNARLGAQAGPQVLEGDSGYTPAVFTVTLSTPAQFTVTVDYVVSSGIGAGGAIAGEDFVPISGTLTFPPGQTVMTYTVQIIGDTVQEPDESYRSTLTNGTVPIIPTTSLAAILNDDNYVYLPLVLH